MTHDDIRAYGKAYGILNSVLRLSSSEVETCCFEPAERLKAAITKRERKLTPAHHERIAEALATVSPDAVGRISEADTGIFWIAFHQAQAAGRPSMYGEPMKTIAFRIPESLAIMAQGKAMAEGKTLSEVIRDALEKYTGTVGFDKEKYDRENGITK